LDHQEAAILALGAIADQDGSYCEIELHLDNLVPFLIAKLDSESGEIRATTCWTLSKFSDWVGNNAPDQIFQVYHKNLVQKMADKEESVQ